MKKDCSAYPKVKKPVKTFMSAYLLTTGTTGREESVFLARIPCIITTVPEIPDAVICEGNCYVLTKTYPLTYARVVASRATRI
jgi:hypothetical protein